MNSSFVSVVYLEVRSKEGRTECTGGHKSSWQEGVISHHPSKRPPITKEPNERAADWSCQWKHLAMKHSAVALTHTHTHTLMCLSGRRAALRWRTGYVRSGLTEIFSMNTKKQPENQHLQPAVTRCSLLTRITLDAHMSNTFLLLEP